MRKQDDKDGSALSEITHIRKEVKNIITGSYGLTSREQSILCTVEEKLYKLMCDIETRERKEMYASE